MSNTIQKGLQLRSLVTQDGKVRLSLEEKAFFTPKPGQVLIRVEAAPINPSDLILLLATADPGTLRQVGDINAPVLEGDVPDAMMPTLKSRFGKSMPIGNEATGTVVAAGEGAEDLVGCRVTTAGGTASFSEYLYADARMAITLPEHAVAADGASGFVNPMTALAMIEVMKAGDFNGLINTAAASNLGQMLVRLCQAENVPLINIVRKSEQMELLRNMGAQHVINQSDADFIDTLTRLIDETSIMLAFDAIGGGELGGQVLQAMENSATGKMAEYSRYGSSTFKQLYIYGGLGDGKIVLPRSLGLCWGVNGFLLTLFLASADPATVKQMRTRVMNELTTTFKTDYSAEISLKEALDLETCRTFAARRTGEKYLLCPMR